MVFHSVRLPFLFASNQAIMYLLHNAKISIDNLGGNAYGTV